MYSAQFDFSVALIIGLAPALGILYWSMRRYDVPFTQYRLFDDRRLFGGFAVGMMFGAIAAFIEVNVASIIFVLAASLMFEESFKMVWLNRKRYRGRFDTTFYGIAVGVGTAAMLGVATVLRYLSGGAADFYTPENLVLFSLYSLSLNLIQADTGAIIGFGASRGETIWPFVKAVLVRLAHTLMLLAFIVPGTGEPWELIAVVTSLAFAGILYHYVYTVLLPGTLPDDIRQAMRREKRRARKARV